MATVTRRGGAISRSLVLAAALFAGLVGTPPARAAVFDPETFTLANGLQVVVIPNHRAPIVTHMVWYKVGAADDPPGKSGIAHFLEHLMFRGTKTLAPGEFSAAIARVGGEENAFTGQDQTAYFQTVAVEHLELAMRLEADRMANLALGDAVVLPERDVILEERRQRVDNDPGAQLAEAVQSALYLNHPYRIPVIGWEHEMRGLATADALDFYRRWYRPNNAVLVVSGDVTAAAVRPLAEKYYGPIAAGPVPERGRLAEPPARAPRRVVLESPRVQQPSWSRRYLAPGYRTAEDGEAYALEVLAEILGGGPTSRLYRRLVIDSKVATVAGAAYEPDRLDTGSFALYGSPQAGGKVEAVEAALEAEIAELLAKGVTQAEVDGAKTLMLADAIKARDSLTGPAHIIGTALTTGGTLADVEAWPERIGAVTVEQVNAAARAVLRPEASVTGVLLAKPTS